MNAISVRHPRFGLRGPGSLHWLSGEAFRSQFFNSFSMLFPSGERYFIESLRRVIGEIGDPELQSDVRRFIGQEASHRRMHDDYNRCLESLGLTNLAERFVAWRISHSGLLSPLDHVAITAGVEHFTTVLGEGALRNDDWLAGADAELVALWKWHAAEEIEHGSIPLRVYRDLGGGYLRRVFWFLYVCVTLSLDVSIQTLSNLRRSNELWRRRTWGQGLAFLFGRGGPARLAIAAIPKYLRPRYAPPFPHRNTGASKWLDDNAHRFRQD